MGEELKLLIRTSSPYILRIVWSLKLKGLEYDTVYEDQDLNPIHENAPVLLVHAGKLIVEPLVILEYIDETWNQNPLLSQDPYEKAVARFWAKFAEDKLLASIKKAFTNQGKEEGREEALKNWKHLEEELKEKRFFGGEAIGLVDIVVGWIAYSLNAMEEMIGHYGPQLMITQQRFPLLAKWKREIFAHSIIKENSPSTEQLRRRFEEFEALNQTQYQMEFPAGHHQTQYQVPYQTGPQTLHQIPYQIQPYQLQYQVQPYQVQDKVLYQKLSFKHGIKLNTKHRVKLNTKYRIKQSPNPNTLSK